MVISMLKIRRPLGRLIFNMGIAIPGKTVFLIETAPRVCVGNQWRIYSISVGTVQVDGVVALRARTFADTVVTDVY